MTTTELLRLVEATLDEVLPPAAERPCALHEAMRYAVGTGGKRIRPLVCLAAAVAAGGDAAEARYPAAAIEILHNYTLVHDDLPAMDNDVLRRGKPTVWKQFGEAVGILAGDALLPLAFAAAARAPRNVAAIVGELADRGVGVVRGQVEDLARAAGRGADVDFIYERKTADLFIAAAKMGAFAAGAEAPTVGRLGDYALHLGLAFQFEDDLLDGDSPYPQAETLALVDSHTRAALAALEGLGGPTDFLRELAERLRRRTV